MARPKVYDVELAEKLLAGAAEQVAAGGPDALSLRRLAEAADTSTSAIYSLFGGKDALLRAVYQRAFRSFGASQHAVPSSPDPAEELHALGRAYRHWALANPHLFQLMFGPGLLRADAQTGELANRTKEPLLATVRRAQAMGRVGAEHDPEVVAQGMWGLVHGLVTLELALGEHAPAQVAGDDAYDRCLTAAVRGWA